jgi:hypothetical protein
VTLDVTKSILQEIRVAVGLAVDAVDFDTELLMHINSAIGKLNQNGIGNFIVVNNEELTWNDLQNPDQVEGNKYFQTIPLFIAMSTKLVFDPPPPSAVPVYQNSIDQMLWRLKVAYEEPYVAPAPEEDDIFA